MIGKSLCCMHRPRTDVSYFGLKKSQLLRSMQVGFLPKSPDKQLAGNTFANFLLLLYSLVAGNARVTTHGLLIE